MITQRHWVTCGGWIDNASEKMTDNKTDNDKHHSDMKRTLNIQSGRPCYSTLFASIVSRHTMDDKTKGTRRTRKVNVLCCGPKSLVREVENQCGKYSAQFRLHVM